MARNKSDITAVLELSKLGNNPNGANFVKDLFYSRFTRLGLGSCQYDKRNGVINVFGNITIDQLLAFKEKVDVPFKIRYVGN